MATAHHGRPGRWRVRGEDSTGLAIPSFVDPDGNELAARTLAAALMELVQAGCTAGELAAAKKAGAVSELIEDYRDGRRSGSARARRPDRKTTVEEYAERWLAVLDGKRPATTMVTYRSDLRAHILPALGKELLVDVDMYACEDFVLILEQSDLAASTIHRIFRVLSSMMGHASRGRVLSHGNPCAGVELPEIGDRNPYPYTVAEIQALAETITPRYEVMVWLACLAGLRLGEAAGLRRDLVDRDRRTVTVLMQQQAGKSVRLKTAASRATVPVDQLLIDKVAEHEARWCDLPLKPDTAYRRGRRGWQPRPDALAAEGLLVVTRYGTPVRRNVFGGHWREAVEEVGLPAGTRYHDLKAWYTTKLGQATRDPKLTQIRSRHARMSTTTDTYWGAPQPVAEESGRGVFDAIFA